MSRSIFLVVVVAMTTSILVGCGQASSPVERQEKREGVEQAQGPTATGGATTPPASGAVGNIPISGIMGEAIETPSFEYRILDIYETDNYYYLENPSIDMQSSAISQAGKLVVLTYSMTNTNPQNVKVNLGGMLHVRVGDKVEFYEESGEAAHPYSGGIFGGPELAPREVLLGQFIFDVPTDAKPELLVVLFEDEIEEPRGEAGAVDLTQEDPQGPTSEEILGLQYEYFNMFAWEEAYNLYAQESKDRVPLDRFISVNEALTPSVFNDFSVPSIDISGDRATMHVVRTYSTEDASRQQEEITQEAQRESEGWRIVMRANQYEFYRNPPGTTTG